MQIKEFDKFYHKFEEASVDDKIDMYCTTTNLTENQYMQLLRVFPPSQIRKLEKAMS